MSAVEKEHGIVCQKAVVLIANLCTQDSLLVDRDTCEEFLFLISRQDYGVDQPAQLPSHNGLLPEGDMDYIKALFSMLRDGKPLALPSLMATLSECNGEAACCSYHYPGHPVRSCLWCGGNHPANSFSWHKEGHTSCSQCKTLPDPVVPDMLDASIPVPVPGIVDAAIPVPVPGIVDAAIPVPVPGIVDAAIPVPVPGIVDAAIPVPVPVPGLAETSRPVLVA
ncbi:hypothetical protein P4O66_004039 [Electrophorus voltai]|uniref:Uncharacterized protein n=1 Tax=Electrophorus voltai TaxID=2609070 RepID=A0AAD9E3P6_9TELE|nr:hypothetical protein P4O66_004039 [Electrophorus voltai]